MKTIYENCKHWVLLLILLVWIPIKGWTQAQKFDMVVEKIDGTELVLRITDDYPLLKYRVNTLQIETDNSYISVPCSEIKRLITRQVVSYTLTYMVDGKVYKSQEIESGASITGEAAPTKEGYTFSGWSEIPATMPAKDVTVTGSFTINKYKFAYMVDDKEYKVIDVEYGAAITPEAAPTKEGYTFSGWSLIPEKMPAKDVTVNGSFTINKYKLVYMVDGTEYKTFDVEYGADITSEAAPTKEGYTFSGWSEIPETMPAKDVTVNGSFTINKYKLVYKVDEEEYKSYDVEYGAAITPEAAPTKEGYTFSGWSLIPEKMPAKDMTITGSFTKGQYKLTYMLDGETYKTISIDFGTAITAEAAPIKEGYTFSGWSEIPATMPAKDVVVTGSFTINKYKLTYMVDGTEYKSFDVEYEAYITPESEPTKEGYVFSGWSLIPVTMPAKDVTVTGSFTINKYKLTYMVDGTEYKTFDVEYGADITPEMEPTKEGYAFSGWSEIPATMPARDMMIWGGFSINRYKLTYMVDGTEYKTLDVEYGADITSEAAPTKEGYTFSDWSLIPEKMPAKDVTVTGSFTINKYKLAYMVDGTEYKTFDVKYGADITSEATPTKEGYTFSGWSEIPATMPAKDVTVTGSFTINKYKLTYIVGDKEYKTIEVEYGADITPEVEPTKEGYTFSGWRMIPKKMPAKEVTITGSFAINSYKLIYKVDDEVYKVYDVEYDADIVAEAAPTKNGYTFSGWTLIPEKMPSHDVTVTGWFVKEHDTFEEDGAGYEMNEDKTVTFTKQEKCSDTCEIPASVVIDGQKYQVTSIAEGAFKDNTNLKELSIPESIVSIGDGALAGCTNLEKINLYSDKPVSIDQADASSVFSGVDTENCILYVPAGTAEAYRQAEGWKVFKNIVEMEDPDDINDINADDGTYEIYTLGGIHIETLHKGVNIIRYSDGSTQKVFVK